MTSSTWDEGAGDDSGFHPENVSKHDTGAGYGNGDNFGNGTDYGGNDAGGRDDGDGCRICASTEHYARECPEKTEGGGECYGCGESGHIKADCTNGVSVKCKACKEDGHSTDECEANRIHLMFAEMGIKDITAEAAWQLLEQADKTRDVDDIKEAVFTYAKADPNLTLVELEKAFRDTESNTYLIAKKQEVSVTHTVVNLQGAPGQEFVISFQFSAKPRRAKFAEGWPETPEENIERLANSGFVMDGFVLKCRNCDEIGHLNKDCTEEKDETRGKVILTCSNCENPGHLARDCSAPRKINRNGCKNCGSVEHFNKDCPEERSAEGVECKNCSEIGHFSKDCPTRVEQVCFNCHQPGHRKPDCPNERVMKCNNCDGLGHFSKQCSKPRDYSRMECTNCKEKGHTHVRCKKPAKVEEEDGGGDLGDGGDFDGAGGNGGGGGFEDPGSSTGGGGGGGWEDGGESASAGPAAAGGGWGSVETPAASGW